MKIPESVLLNTGCVPDYAYVGALVILGLIAWRAWVAHTRQSRAR